MTFADSTVQFSGVEYAVQYVLRQHPKGQVTPVLRPHIGVHPQARGHPALVLIAKPSDTTQKHLARLVLKVE